MGAILVFLVEMIPRRGVFGQGSYALIPIFAKIIHHSGACSTTISQITKKVESLEKFFWRSRRKQFRILHLAIQRTFALLHFRSWRG